MRTICIFTGTRADYGLMKPVMAHIKNDPELCLQIVASGTHLAAEFGMTITEIESDGFSVNEKIEILHEDNTAVGVAHSAGRGVAAYADALTVLRPDILVVLGDRFETFAATTAATICRIPVAHIHGGELTQGAMDDAFRHSISKMSHIHFASTASYAQRIVQLGERPERVFNVGALGAENIERTELLTKLELEQDLGTPIDANTAVITFHAATLDAHTGDEQFSIVLEALGSIPGLRPVFTRANADEGGMLINEMIDQYVESHSDSARVFASLGYRRYLSLLQHAGLMVGNSSSGIIEAAGFELPVVNIGDRQKGRLCPSNVINCKLAVGNVIEAIEKAMSLPFRNLLIDMENPYRKPETAQTIVSALKNQDLAGILKKEFYDVDFAL